MSKLDVYLRSIERFGATGAILTSNQAVTLRFPTGDRHATQVTPHDQLVGLVREVAPPAALDLIDKNRPARFDYDSSGTMYSLAVVPRLGAWQVTVEAATGAAPPAARIAPANATTNIPVVAATAAAPTAAASEMAIERGQYDGGPPPARPTASGSGALDELTRAARAAGATDVYVAAGAQPVQRVNGELVAAQGRAIDGDQLSRELGVVAPAEARAAWSELGSAVFAYGDGTGRIRVTLARDHRGPSAAMRLLPEEAPGLGSLHIDDWLQRSGLVLVAGPSGSGKTVTLAALVRALGDRRRRVITIEDPIEMLHVNPWISQREVGRHVASAAAGIRAAMLEGADAIAIAAVGSSETASAIVDAVAGGHIVVAAVLAPSGGAALERVLELVPADRREVARGALNAALLATVVPVQSRSGRSFEVHRPGERRV
ncbi:MAG: ATPase, T2SS/T4P/T4SS family [Kofleriaceae bacterium]